MLRACHASLTILGDTGKGGFGRFFREELKARLTGWLDL
jgi:hypothetical protein